MTRHEAAKIAEDLHYLYRAYLEDGHRKIALGIFLTACFLSTVIEVQGKMGRRTFLQIVKTGMQPEKDDSPPRPHNFG